MTHDQAVKNDQAVTERSWAVNLINAAKELGRYPIQRHRAKDDAGKKQRLLGKNIRLARNRKVFTPEEESELDFLQAEVDAEADALDVCNFQLLLTENDFWHTY